MSNEFEAYGMGIVHASVCTSLSVEEATKRLNEQYPTGIQSQWELSKNEHFSCGEHKNGCDCPDHPDNKHYLFSC